VNLRKHIFLIVFFINFFGLLSGLDPLKKITQYTSNTWKAERGLPDNTVLAIAQDRSGYLWLGTAEGLVRFDGVTFSIFNSTNTAEFREHFVNNLYVDRGGILWIATRSGKLLSLEKGKFKNHFLAPMVVSIWQNCLAEDIQGNLWIGTSDGLFYRPPGSNQLFKKCLLFPSIKIVCIATDRSGRLLISTANKDLYRLEKERLIRILSAVDQLNSDISIIMQARNGCLWLGTEGGLYSYQDGRLSHYRFKLGLTASIMSLIEDHDGNLWAGSEGGLYRWNQGTFQFLGTDQYGGSNFVCSLYEDAEGSLWVGTVDGGLTQIRDEKITTLTGHEGLNGEVFRSLHGDDAGALWVGGYGGYLNRYRNGRVENFSLPARFRREAIWSFYFRPGYVFSRLIGTSPASWWRQLRLFAGYFR